MSDISYSEYFEGTFASGQADRYVAEVYVTTEPRRGSFGDVEPPAVSRGGNWSSPILSARKRFAA